MIEVKIVVIFEINLDLRNFEFGVEKSELDFGALFIMRFKLVSVNEICEIYRKINYITHDCEIITSFKFFKEIKFFLLKDKFFIL